jgi:DNA-binding transcriptional MerR regulator
VGQTSARRSAHRRRWRSASPATRERLLRYGRYQGASPSEIRRYYESGRTLERLRPTPQRLLDDPTRWKPYIETHRHTIDRRMGQGTAAGLLAMTQSQKSGRYGAGYGVYVQAGEKRR